MIRVFLFAAAFLGIAACTYSATQQVAVVNQPGPYLATFYSDDELAALSRFHSSPGTALALPSGIHVEMLGNTQSVQVDYGAPLGLQTVLFQHVRVLDGTARGSTGWLATQHVGPPTPMPRQ